jgi:predicted ester cyclase
MSITETAKNFAHDCDSGKGWETCAQYCHEDASFYCQADALSELKNLGEYVDWAAGLLGPIPDANYELVSLATDEERNQVSVFCTFKGTQTGAGPVDPPTGKTISSDYVYLLSFEGDKIKHMHKVWNDGYALKELGWA